MKDKTYLPDTIGQNPFPVAGEAVIPAGSTSLKEQTEYNPSSYSGRNVPFNSVASAVVSRSINTQQNRILGNYQFGVLGAIQISSKTTSANIKISPDGIVGVNSSGVTTFTLDGTVGSLTLMGHITATGGYIGGFTIESNYLWAGTGVNTAGISPADYPFWAGATYANRATAPFRVTPAGAVNATSGEIAGWTLATTTLSKNNVILDSAGKITVANGNNKVELIVDGGNGYIDFYYGGSRRGRLRGTTAGSGIRVVSGDFVIENSKSLLLENTGGNDWARFGLNGSNQLVLALPSGNQFYITNSGGGDNLFTVSNDRSYVAKRLKFQQMASEPSSPEVGDVSYADGVSWNPGAGPGIYAYLNTGGGASWHILN